MEFHKTSVVLIILPALLLCALSLLMLLSIAPNRLLPQALFMLFSLFIGWGVYRIGAKNLYFFVRPLYLILIVLLLATVVFGRVTRGSARWLEIAGIRGQVSELAKPTLLLTSIFLLEKGWVIHWKKQVTRLLVFATIMSIPIVLVLLQPDLGTGIVIAVITSTTLFFSGIPRWMIVSFFLLGLGLIPISQQFLADYQLRRIESFLDPFADPKGDGYQVIQSTIAVGSGQVFGRGLGHGTQSRLRFLPERQTDFMFASLAEELGLVGGVLTLLLYASMIFGLTRAAVTSRERFDFLVLTGCVGWLFFQSATNIAMNLGLAPITGITLPFLSAGGSSLVSSSIMLGLAASSMKTLNFTR